MYIGLCTKVYKNTVHLHRALLPNRHDNHWTPRVPLCCLGKVLFHLYKAGDILEPFDSKEFPLWLWWDPAFWNLEQYMTNIGGQHCILGGSGIMGIDGQNPIGNSPSSHPSAEHLQRSSFPMFPQSGGEPEKWNHDPTVICKFFLTKKSLQKNCKINYRLHAFSPFKSYNLWTCKGDIFCSKINLNKYILYDIRKPKRLMLKKIKKIFNWLERIDISL